MTNKLWIPILCFFSFTAVSFAAISNSSNYSVISDTVGGGGASNINTSNYSAVMGTGEPTAGLANTTNYKQNVGFASIEREPSISLNPSVQLLSLGLLHDNAVTFGSHTLSVYSNSRKGYSVRVYGSTLTSGGNTIEAIGASNAFSTIGTEQFGINLVANTVPSVGAAASGDAGTASAPYATTNKFAYQSGDVIASATTFSTDTYTVSYIANIATGTAAGYYTTELFYQVTSDF